MSQHGGARHVHTPVGRTNQRCRWTLNADGRFFAGCLRRQSRGRGRYRHVNKTRPPVEKALRGMSPGSRQGYKGPMADVLFIVSMVAFLGLSVVLIRICDRIIGPDEDAVLDAAGYESDEEAVAA